MFTIFREEFEDRGRIQGEVLRLMLKRLLIKSVRLLDERKAMPSLLKANIAVIRQFNQLVDTHFREQHSVSDYAKQLHKSPKTLSNIFKQAAYASPLKVINERILLEAKRLLLFSDLTAREVGFQLGYAESAHFSKFFRAQTGAPPIRWRDQHKFTTDDVTEAG